MNTTPLQFCIRVNTKQVFIASLKSVMSDSAHNIVGHFTEKRWSYRQANDSRYTSKAAAIHYVNVCITGEKV